MSTSKIDASPKSKIAEIPRDVVLDAHPASTPLPEVGMRMGEPPLREEQLLALLQTRYKNGAITVLVKPRWRDSAKADGNAWMFANSYLMQCWRQKEQPRGAETEPLDYIDDLAILHGPNNTVFSSVDLTTFDEKDPSGRLVEIFFEVATLRQNRGLRPSDRAFLAAVLATGLIGFEDKIMADQILAPIPESRRVAALTDALIEAVPYALSLSNQLLEWGALPDEEGSFETLSPLEVAIRLGETAVLRLLLKKAFGKTLDQERLRELVEFAKRDADAETNEAILGFSQEFERQAP